MSYDVFRSIGEFTSDNPGEKKVAVIQKSKEADAERGGEVFKTHEEDAIPGAAYVAFRCPEEPFDCAGVYFT